MLTKLMEINKEQNLKTNFNGQRDIDVNARSTLMNQMGTSYAPEATPKSLHQSSVSQRLQDKNVSDSKALKTSKRKETLKSRTAVHSSCFKLLLINVILVLFFWN